ncbi:hypothetical protein NFA_28780 [Nocardia farcinica IFM 10152]|uniref:Uncharacterized protein n=1 Tax=Nocardia farcinica (strain IFM 10152) TaxID=247156 RepID=Q5YVR6_NOCFA|nr:hypothetical protein NFA_28780 [Nocardia farcinica IFM 10152]
MPAGIGEHRDQQLPGIEVITTFAEDCPRRHVRLLDTDHLEHAGQPRDWTTQLPQPLDLGLQPFETWPGYGEPRACIPCAAACSAVNASIAASSDRCSVT